jgi:Predicted membrane protein/domain
MIIKYVRNMLVSKNCYCVFFCALQKERDSQFTSFGGDYIVGGEKSCAVAAGLNPQIEYAGFLLRVAASLIDGLILVLAGFILNKVLSSVWIDWALPLVYFVGFNCSKYQGTAGKIVVGIKITDLNGNRISFFRALARYCFPCIFLVIQLLCILYSWTAMSAEKQGEGFIAIALLILNSLVFFIGYLMTAFTSRKQALHDIVCETLVVRESKCLDVQNGNQELK